MNTVFRPLIRRTLIISRNYMEMRRKKLDRRNGLLVIQKEKLRLLMTLWVVEKVRWQ